jgi:hypothetical protein
MRRAIALAVWTALAAPPVLADPAPPVHRSAPESAPAPRTGASDCARARKAGQPCQLTIEAEPVGGDRPVPDGTDLRLRRFEPAGSMLRLRRDFIDQIAKSADEL